MADTMSARWVVTEDADMVGVTVDLWNGYSVHVLAWKDDSVPPFVALRDDGGNERDLADETCRSFRAWLDGARGRSTMRPARTRPT
jgi:hypothetical protein